MLHTQSSSILHWVKSYTACEFVLMDFRDRIRSVLSEKSLSVREVSLRAGSDSMLSKVLNPDKRGGIKSPTIDKLEEIARALGVNPGWLAFGDVSKISGQDLREMVENAVEEIQAGMRIEEIRNTVASALRDQLALHLAVGADPDSQAEASAPDKSAQPLAPTNGDEPEGSHTS